MPDFIRLRCPACGKKVKAAPDLLGKTVRCTCSQKLRIPFQNPHSGPLPTEKSDVLHNPLDWQPQRHPQTPVAAPQARHLEFHHASWKGIFAWVGIGLFVSGVSSALVRITSLLSE